MAKPDVLRALRRFCLECQGESPQAVRGCRDVACPLHGWRLPPEAAPEQAPLLEGTPALPPESDAARKAAAAQERLRRQRQALRAIRRQCLVCAGDRQEARACAARECPLWHLRFGVMPETYKAVRARFFAPKKLSLF